MIRCALFSAALMALPAVASATDSPQSALRSIPQNLKLLVDSHAPARDFRIASTLDGDGAGPGDRPASELFEINGPQLPRQPRAPMNARMSMSLDEGVDAFRPAFSLGGVGAALVRLTDALLDQ